jgi:group I intron endonuclease
MIFSGVYCIENLITHKRYIGSSTKLYTRFKHHKYCLDAGRHANPHLQNAWNEYGDERFEFKIIELIPPKKLVERSQRDNNTGRFVKEKIIRE